MDAPSSGWCAGAQGALPPASQTPAAYGRAGGPTLLIDHSCQHATMGRFRVCYVLLHASSRVLRDIVWSGDVIALVITP
jgi:hypothetical protein